MGEPMDSFASTFTIFIICDSPQKSSTAQKVYSHSSLWHSLYLFGELYVIMVLRPCPPIYSGGEVRKMESILSFILSVGANVAAYYICKWLDGWFTGREH